MIAQRIGFSVCWNANGANVCQRIAMGSCRQTGERYLAAALGGTSARLDRAAVHRTPSADLRSSRAGPHSVPTGGSASFMPMTRLWR